jgi:hypothetical protein
MNLNILFRRNPKKFVGCVPLKGTVAVKTELLSGHSSSNATFFASSFSSTAQTHHVDLKVYKNPSVLENVDISKPGTVWHLLQKHYKDSKSIRHSDFLKLLQAVRPSHPSDGRLVITALKDMKRCNRFICTPELAFLSVNAIIKSVSPPLHSSERHVDDDIHTTVTDAKFQIQAACTVMNAFLDKQTGLYTSLSTQQLEMCLNLLHKGIKGVSKEVVQEDTNVASMVFQTIEILINRASNPTRHMKKRAKRSYLLHRKCSEGPSPKCIDLSVNLILSMANGNDDHDAKCMKMAEDLIHMYSMQKHLGSIMQSTLDILRESKTDDLID